MEIRHFEGVAGKRDQYQIDPRTLKVRPNFNIRDLESPKARERLDILKAQVKAQGVIEALEIEFDGTTPWINEGHRRHKVVMELIAEGEDIKTVPCIPERRGTKDDQRTLHMLMRKKEEYEPLEYAAGVARMVNVHGWEPAKLAIELGFKSKVSIEQYLDMLAMPDAVKEKVNNNEVSATLALKVTKQNGAEADKVLDEAKAQVEASGAKRQRITPKAVARVTGKGKPKPAEINLDFVSIANQVEDAARRAGGIDKLGQERTTALLRDITRTLKKAKGEKVPDFEEDEHSRAIFDEQNPGTESVVDHPDPLPPPANRGAPIADVMASIDRITAKRDEAPAMMTPVAGPDLRQLVSQEIQQVLGLLAKVEEDQCIAEREPGEKVPVEIETIARGARLYRQIIGEAA